MITTLIIAICTSAERDDCQVYAAQRWNDQYRLEACLASIEPTLDTLRREGLTNVGAYCEESEE